MTSSILSALETLSLFQSAFAGEQAVIADRIVADGNQVGAQTFLDEWIREIPPDQILQKLRQGQNASRHPRTLFDFPTRFPPEIQRRETTVVLRGEISLANLALELEVHFRDKDPEAAVILMEGSAVFSRGVARALRNTLESDDPSISQKTGIFVYRLVQLLLDPRLHEFPDIIHHPVQDEAILIRRFAEKQGWAITDIFGRLTFLTAAEFKKILLGEITGILHPSIKIETDGVSGTNPQAVSTTSPISPATISPYSCTDFPVALAYPNMEGALILARGLPTRQIRNPDIPYPLLRRVIYKHLAEGHFEFAAQMVENISDPYVISRLFDDLRMGEGKEPNGIKNAGRFFANTAAYAGKMFAVMTPDQVVGLLNLLYQHVRWHDQKALDSWLLLTFKAIRPKELWEENFGPAQSLPRLSIILGTLIEWIKTRELAQRLLKMGLDPNHPAHFEMIRAMERLNERHPAFVSPFEWEASGFEKIFDEEKVARELGVEKPAGMLGKARELLSGKIPIAPHFNLPPTVLAGREEIFERFQEKLRVVLAPVRRGLGEGGSPEAATQPPSPALPKALAEVILFSLPPAEVFRLMQKTCEELKYFLPPYELLATLLLHQPTEVVIAFFKAWGHGLREDEEIAPMGRSLTALWKIGGDFSQRLVTDAIDQALKEDEASILMQKMLSQHGCDDLLMTEQMEIYLELAEKLGKRINPYEIFVTTGVIRPEDLSGKFRKEAIHQALWNLKDIDCFGKIKVGTKREFIAGYPGMEVELTVPDPESGIPLSEDQQTQYRRWALDVLVNLDAEERAVVNYLMSKLEGPNGRLYYDALDRMGRKAQERLVRYIDKQSRVVQWIPMMPERLGHDLGIEAKKVVRQRPIKQLAEKFPLTSRAMRRHLWGRLKEESKRKKMELAAELSQLGDEALVLFSIMGKGEAVVREEARVVSARELLFYTRTVESSLIPPLVQMAELIATPKADEALTKLLALVRHKGTKEQSLLILRALARLESKPDYDGPLAVADYLNSDADFAEKLELLDYLEKGNPLFRAISLAEAPFTVEHRQNPFLNRLLGQISDPAFYLFVIRALKDDDMRWTFLNWHTNSDDVGEDVSVFESTRTWPAIIYIAKDESPENLQREIAIHTLFWYFRRAHTCGFRDSLLNVLDPPLRELLKQIEPTLEELFATDLARHADPKDLHYFRYAAKM